jgi:hypothetical protein
MKGTIYIVKHDLKKGVFKALRLSALQVLVTPYSWVNINNLEFKLKQALTLIVTVHKATLAALRHGLKFFCKLYCCG